MRYSSASILALAICVSAVRADTPSDAIPTPLERALLHSTVTEEALRRATDTTGKPAEITRSKEIIDTLLTRTEGKTAPEARGPSTALATVRRNFDLGLSDAEMGELLVTRSKDERLAAYQAASSRQLSDADLLLLDDEIFWASFDPDRGEPSEEFENEDGSGVRIDIDPDTRDTTVSVYNPDGEDGLPFNLALPTRWVAASEDDAPPEAPDTSDTSDEDIFTDTGPVPHPVADLAHDPEILTPDYWNDHPEMLNGVWSMAGFLFSGPKEWFITSNNDTTLRPSADEAEAVLEELQKTFPEGTELHVWTNLETGEVVRETTYKRRDIDQWDYARHVAKSPDENVAAALEQAQARVEDGVKNAVQDPNGFEQVAKAGAGVQIRVLGGCGGIMDDAHFDGLNLAVRDTVDKWCEFNPGVPDPIKSKLLGGGSQPWTAVFRVTPDPRSDNLIMRGTSWGGRVHYQPDTFEINSISGPHLYANPFGTRPKGESEDTLLTGTAMGAEDDETL